MLRYLVGLLAAILWAGTIIGLFLIFRSSPRHPFKTIKEFRQARRRLSKPSAPLVEVVNEADLAEPVVFVEQPGSQRGSTAPAAPLEETEAGLEPDTEDDSFDDAPLDEAEAWDDLEPEADEIEEEEWEEEEEEEYEEALADGYEVDEDEEEYEEEEYEENDPEEDADEDESVSTLDIILVDDFGKPAK